MGEYSDNLQRRARGGSDAPYDDPAGAARPSEMDAAALFLALKSWWEDDSAFSREWRSNATSDFDFVAGDQWTPEDESTLKDQKRVPVVFNRTITMLRAVAGMEINGRHEITYLPRSTEDAKVNEVLTGASKWMADNCDGEDEESEAFQHTLICGMGWCLSGDTMVRLPEIQFATSRSYSGAIVKIDLENGKQLTGTPNHPVLTDRGWKKLGSLNEGDNLVTSGILERVKGLPVHHFDEVEARLEDKIDAFRAGREVGTFATSTNDFYGDGAGSEIHVVYADRLLLNKLRDFARFQHRQKRTLARRHIFAKWRSALLGGGVFQHAACTAVGEASFDAWHRPSSDASRRNLVSEFAPGRSDRAPNLFSIKREVPRDFRARHHVGEVHGNDRIHSLCREGSVLGLSAQAVSGLVEPCSHRAPIESNPVANFFDCKPLLEIEARKLGCADDRPATTRVLRKVVDLVSDFQVHDIGTSIGFYVAGDVITSNCEHRLDWEEEPDGKYVEQAVNPLEMYWDKTARKKNLSDARRIARVKRMPASDAMALFPGYSVDDLDAKWAQGHEPGKPNQSIEERRKKLSEAGAYPDRCDVTIVQFQWWEREAYWLVADPTTNTKAELTDADYRKLVERGKALGLKFPAAKMTRRAFKQAFVGAKVLEAGDAPIPDRFSFTCITGELHHNKGTWFGLIRVMRDPAMWANKWLVQTLHIMNSNAKGGILAETDAFEDQRQAEQTYARPEAITWMKKGALTGGNGPKFTKKPVAEFPSGYFNLLEFAISSLRDVTGINLELLGLKDVNQPGVLEAQRKQAGMTVLATMFDSLRRARKQTGRIRLYFIQNFLSDGRLIRIAGPEGAQVIPLLRDKTLGTYDVVVDDTPSAPNQKQANWAIIQPMLAAFKDQLVARPDIFAMLLDYSPLPSRVVEAVKAAIMKPSETQVKQAQLAEAKEVAAIGKTQSEAELNKAKAAATHVDATYNAVMAQNIAAKNNGQVDSLREGLDVAQKAAVVRKENAQADKLHAEATKAGHEAHGAQIRNLIDMLAPVQSFGQPAQP